MSVACKWMHQIPRWVEGRPKGPNFLAHFDVYKRSVDWSAHDIGIAQVVILVYGTQTKERDDD